MHRPPRNPFTRRLSVALTTVLLGLAACPAASTAAVELQNTYAGPIADGGACTAEPPNAVFANQAFNPAAPPDGANIPSTDDIVPRNEAGAHADYCVAFNLTPHIAPPRVATPEYPADPATDPIDGDDPRQIVVDTPEGFAAAASSIPVCSDADFGTTNHDPVNCPDSKGGDALVRVHLGVAPGASLQIVAGASATGIYNLEAGPNEAARLGIVIDTGLLPPSKFIVRVVFTGGQHNRLRSIVDNPPREIESGGTIVPIYVESVGLRFYGRNTAHPGMVGDAFAENGTQCGTPLSGDFTISTYGDRPNATTPVTSSLTSESHTLSGCGALDFRPDVSVDTTQKAPAVPTEAKVAVNLGQNPPAQNATALLKDAVVTLPDGLEIGAQVASRDGGLRTCAADAFRVLEQVAPDCPAGSRVGSARIDSPLLREPLVGNVYLGPQPAPGEQPDLYVETAFAGATAPDAPRIKLVGSASVDSAGRVKTVFRDNPQLRFSTLTLTFDGGPNALLTNPQVCGTTSGSAEFTPRSGAAPVNTAPSLTINQDCAVPQFRPNVSVTATSPRAGVKAPTTIVVSRADRAAWLDRVAVSLPSGLLADLNGVPECSAAAAQAASCPADTRIATVTVLAGAGPQPYAQTGAMYLTQRPPGAVAGATIITHAKIGDVDLGQVVVPGRINLRPTDAGLDYISAVPMRVHGVALGIRAIGVSLDRPGFALNPSSCGPLGYSGAYTDQWGNGATSAGAIAYSGCADLPFKPRIRTELSGRGVRAGGHPNVHFTIQARRGDANLRATRLTLPSGVSTDLKNLQVTCTMEQFHAGACPDATDVGWVNADVWIAPERIEGRVYLVKVPGETLPGLGLAFTGRYAQRVVSRVRITKTGRITTDFGSIPDLPLKRLEVRLFGGEKGPVQLARDWCNPRTQWSTLVTAQGNQRERVRSRLHCARDARVRFGDRRGLSLRQFGLQGRKLQSIKVTLPSGYSFVPSRARSSRHGWVRTKGDSRSPRLRVTKRTFRAAPRGRKASNVRIKLDGSAVRASKRARSRDGRVTLRVRLAFTNGTVETQSIRVRPR